MNVLHYMKAAVITGVSFGVGDGLYQYVHGLKISRTKRKWSAESWDATRSTKTAVLGAAFGPILAFPTDIVNGGFSAVLPSLMSVAIVEVCLVPFFVAWNRDLLFNFKSNIPRLMVIVPGYTLGLCAAMAFPLDHISAITNICHLGVLLPEGVLWIGGIGFTAFCFLAFTHQTALSMESMMNRDKDFLIARARFVGLLSASSLVGLTLFDIYQFPFVNLFLMDVFYISGLMYQCFLTYIQSLESERAKAQATHPCNFTAQLRLRTLLNIGTVSATLVSRPFALSGQGAIALGLQCVAAGSWLAYFLTYDTEYEGLEGDAGDWALVSTDEEERRRTRKEEARRERAVRKAEERARRVKAREERRQLLLAQSGLAGTPTTTTTTSVSESEILFGSESRHEVRHSKPSKADVKGDHKSHRGRPQKPEKPVHKVTRRSADVTNVVPAPRYEAPMPVPSIPHPVAAAPATVLPVADTAQVAPEAPTPILAAPPAAAPTPDPMPTPGPSSAVAVPTCEESGPSLTPAAPVEAAEVPAGPAQS